jgi:hypothetical protein
MASLSFVEIGPTFDAGRTRDNIDTAGTGLDYLIKSFASREHVTDVATRMDIEQDIEVSQGEVGVQQ